MIGKVRDLGYVHYKTQLAYSSDQVQIKAQVKTGTELSEVLKLHGVQLEFVGVMAHWKVYTFIENTAQNRSFVYLSLNSNLVFNCLYEVQFCKHYLQAQALFKEEYIFEKHGKPVGLAVLVQRPTMTLRGLLETMWNREQAKLIQ